MEDETETLTHLGLTFAQAKVLLALTDSDASTIKEIAFRSKVHRTDIYRVIEDLEKEGLLEREISTPVKYKAIPIDECVQTLFQRRNNETRKIRRETAKLIRKHKAEAKAVRSLEDRESHSWIVPEGRAVDKIGAKIDDVTESLDVILPWKRFSSGFSVVFSDKIDKALSRKVRMRFAVQVPNDRCPINQLDARKDNPFCEIKYFTSSSYVVLGIYDNREVSLAEYPDASREKSHLMFSTNRAVLSLAKDYFEVLWTKTSTLEKRICNQ